MPVPTWIECQTVGIESNDGDYEGLFLLFTFEALSACVTKVEARTDEQGKTG
jgi:hypothetical protein